MFRIIIVRTVSPLTSHRQLLIKRITPVLISASLNIREYEENKESTSHGPDLCLESSADTSTIVYRCQLHWSSSIDGKKFIESFRKFSFFSGLPPVT